MTPQELLELEGKQVLVVASDAGAALFLAPVIEKIRPLNAVKVIAGKHAAVTFRHQGIIHEQMDEEQPFDIAAQSLLKQQHYGVALLGTNLGPGLEKVIIQKASEYHCRTMAVVDHYWHLWQRFADLEKRIPNQYLPDDIWVFEPWQKDRLITKNIPENRMHVAHHPYFESLKEQNWPSEKRRFCQEYGINPDALVVTYASEPPPTRKTDWKSEEPAQDTIVAVADMVAKTISRLNRDRQPVQLVVKKHPSETEEFLQNIWATLEEQCTVLSDYPPKTLIQASEVVLGMTSIFLLEAQAMGKPTAILSKEKSYYSEILGHCKLSVISETPALHSFIIAQFCNDEELGVG